MLPDNIIRSGVGINMSVKVMPNLATSYFYQTDLSIKSNQGVVTGSDNANLNIVLPFQTVK